MLKKTSERNESWEETCKGSRRWEEIREGSGSWTEIGCLIPLKKVPSGGRGLWKETNEDSEIKKR